MIIAHPRVYPWASDDTCPPADQFDASHLVKPDDTYCLLVIEGDPVGLWVYRRINGVTWEVHTCPAPDAHGQRIRDAAKATVRWMFENTPCRKIIGHVPFNNPRARALAIECGMVDEGVSTKSFLKGGELLDQWMLGLCKE